MNKRYKIARRFLIFWTLFIGIGAVAGSLGMLIDPSGKAMGMDAMLPFFRVLPFDDVLFQNFVFSGIMLLIVNGITNLTASILLIYHKKSGIILGTIFGVTLMLWIIIQFVIFPLNFMSTTYFIFGFAQFVTGYTCYVGYEQSKFHFNPSDYPNISNDNTKLVVFFSRTGYTKKLAYDIANQSGAEIVEITTSELTAGNAGFWWCGRYGMHHWGMPNTDIPVDLTKYDEVTICTPVWVFGISAPIRQFCLDHKGQIKNVNYVITHFMNTRFQSIAKEMDTLLGTTHTAFDSYRCHFGKLKKINIKTNKTTNM